MHIEITKDDINGFRIRVVDADGLTVRTFTYPTIESARRAAQAWRVAYGNCLAPVDGRHFLSASLTSAPAAFCHRRRNLGAARAYRIDRGAVGCPVAHDRVDVTPRLPD